MSDRAWTLTRLSFEAGIWTGRLAGPRGATPPTIRATLRGGTLAEAAPEQAANGQWTIRLGLGSEAMGAGPVTVLFGPADGPPLAAEVIRSGAAEDAPLAADIEDLRTELDLVKSVLRRLTSPTD